MEDNNLTNKKEFVKQRLIDAAIKIIGEKGFRKTTVPMITKKAGLATGTFYLYFRDKSHIFNEAIIHVSSSLRNHIDEVFQQKLSSFRGKSINMRNIKDALHAIYSAFFDYVDNYRDNFLVLFREGLSHREDFSFALEQTYKALAQDTRIRLSTTSQFGIIRPLSSLEAETIAWAIVGMLAQVAQIYITDSYNREELIDILVNFTLNGIRKTEKK